MRGACFACFDYPGIPCSREPVRANFSRKLYDWTHSGKCHAYRFATVRSPLRLTIPMYHDCIEIRTVRGGENHGEKAQLKNRNTHGDSICCNPCHLGKHAGTCRLRRTGPGAFPGCWLVALSLLLCATSISAAIFLTNEMSSPFSGLMNVSLQPLENALAIINGGQGSAPVK
jgi:hypothetical protein